METAAPIFNRSLLRKRQTRAAPHFAQADFLIKHCCEILTDRLADMDRRFAHAVLLGGYHNVAAPIVAQSDRLAKLTIADPHSGGVLCDHELLPFADGTLDAVLCPWGLHWVNDLPGTLAQIRRALRPDGLFLAVLPGPRTLQELRDAFAAASARSNMPLHNHIAPFVEVRDAGGLLQRAGFALPVADSELLTVTYRNALQLLHELRAMGETNMLQSQSRGVLPRRYFPQALAAYSEAHSMDNGRIPATVECVTLTAWAPDASQQQPARRGSGKVNLNEIFS